MSDLGDDDPFPEGNEEDLDPSPASYEEEEEQRESSDGEEEENMQQPPVTTGSRHNSSDGYARPQASSSEPKRSFFRTTSSDGKTMKTSTDELAALYKRINRYQPLQIDIDTKLKPFIPDYMPAVGDIDAFIKVQLP